MKGADIDLPKRRLGGFPNANVVLSIATALFLIGVFALFSILAGELSDKIRQDIEIQVFLDKKASPEEAENVKSLLMKKEFTETKDGKPRIVFISKEDAAKKLTEATGEDFVGFIGENPLRDSYIINIKEIFYNKESMGKIKAEIEAMPGVYEVSYVESLIESINDNISRIGTVVGIFVCVMIVAVVVLINNSIKLALYSQRFLIRSMQLVGATPMFIKRPFLERAFMQGLGGGLVACCLLLLLILFANSQIRELEDLHDYFKTLALFVLLIGLGGGIGLASALFSVNRYLKMKLDQLY